MFVVAISLLLIGCGKKEKPVQTSIPDDALSRYVTAYSQGEISRYDPILLRFSEGLAGAAELQIPQNLSRYKLEISPKIEASCLWEDGQTLLIRPEQPLEPGERYSVTVDLNRFFEKVNLPESKFHFSVKVRELYLQLSLKEPAISRVDDLRFYDVEGILTASDRIDPAALEKVLEARYLGKNVAVEWQHAEAVHQHHFKIAALERGKAPRDLELAFDARFLGIEFREKKSVAIYPMEDFKVTDIRAITEPERFVEISFNDPLNGAQSLEGLVQIQGLETIVLIQKNKIKLFPRAATANLIGKVTVRIEPGVLNIVGDRIHKTVEETIDFDDIKPELKILSNGVMIPQGSTSLFSFAAVNLSAVDLRIIEVAEQSILQFLQVNDPDGNRELHRVGKIIFEEKIPLDGDSTLNLKDWNHFSVNLLAKAALQPGTFYRLEIAFRQSYSLYRCEAEAEAQDSSPFQRFQRGGGYEYDDWNYNWWRDRENPCRPGYYHNKSKSINLLQSDIGLICKSDGESAYQIIVTDLKSGKGVANADIKFYSYSLELLGTTKSDANGFARYEKEEKPFFVVAEKGKQRNVLRLLEGEPLSMSKFDVAGMKRKEGLNGFIYGERGVWRPGDTLHIVFLLDDPDKRIPQDHPVKAILTDPQGRQIFEKSITQHVNRFYYFPIPTLAKGLTGNHLLKIEVGGAVFSKSIKVEAIMPNRLKIHYDQSLSYLKPGTVNKLMLQAEWLHGAPAQNLRADVELHYFQAPVNFEKFPDYAFNFPGERYNYDSEKIFDDTLDANGKGEITIKTNKEKSAGRLKAELFTRVFEPGGAFSSDVYSIDYFSFENYVGLKVAVGDKNGILVTDAQHKIEILTVDQSGKPVPRKNIKVELYKLEWRWWWDQGEEFLRNYRRNMYVSAVMEGLVETGLDGKGTYTFQIDREAWGRYLIKVSDTDGHASGKIVYVDWPGWAGRPRDGLGDGETRLMLSADKEKYAVGETATVSFPSSAGAMALITLEKGDEALEMFWRETSADFTKIDIALSEAMSPNIYVSVWYLQPFDQTENDLPVRLYGVQNLAIYNDDKILHPHLEMDAALAPDAPYTITVFEKNDKPMSYTLAVVDEGLLDLTRFNTPDPYNYFYSKQALGVRTWDIYKYVLGRKGLTFNSLLAVGGGEYGDGLQDVPLINRFKPVVSFAGPFSLEAGEKKSHSLRMPLYTGAVRAMVVAADGDAYGYALKRVPVKKPLMVIASAPRLLTPGETLKLPVTVFIGDSIIRKVQIQVRGDEHFSIEGDSRKSIAVKGKSEFTENFTMKTGERHGTGRIAVQVSSGGEQSEYNFDIEIRYPAAEFCERKAMLIPAGESRTIDVEPIGIPGYNRAIAEISQIPAIDLSGKLKYLLEYPHGCLEQTVSAAFPQLYLGNLTKLDFAEMDRLEGNIREAVRKISGFSTGSGDFSYWPGSDYLNGWASVYAAHFLYEAKQKGYHVPENLTRRWLQAQNKLANGWTWKNSYDEAVQAYRLFVLALYEKGMMGAMNRLREGKMENPLSPWFLAAAYQRSGFSETAEKLLTGNSGLAAEYPLFSEDFASALRDKAVMLLIANELQMKEQAFHLANSLIREINQSDHFNTQTLGTSLLALGKNYSSASDTMRYLLQIGKQSSQEKISLHTIESHPLEKADFGQTVNVKNIGKDDIYLSLVRCGLPRLKELQALSQGLALRADYFSADGKPIGVKSLKRGQDFFVEIQVKNLSRAIDYKNLALSFLIPSGWELHRNLNQGDSRAYSNPDFMDSRDDRVLFYFGLKRDTTATFKLIFNAAYSGSFYLAPVQVNAMYQESIVARSSGSWISIEP